MSATGSPTGSWRWIALVALSCAGAIGWWWSRPSARPDPPEVGPPVVAPPQASEAAEAGAIAIEPAVAPTELATAPARPPAAPAGPVDPCDPEPATAIVRPSLHDLVRDRAAELDDRVRVALRREGASDALREGLLGAMRPEGEDAALARLASAPDRRIDGFDHLSAVLSVLAWQALAAGDPRRARELAGHAARATPDDPVPLLCEALAAEALADPIAARAALAEAFRLQPDEPAIALAYARRLRHGAELGAALAALDAYLSMVPEDDALARLRERLVRRREAMAGAREARLRGITLVAPRAASRAAADRALSIADGALGEAARLLGVERRAELAVFVYASRAEMLHATCAQAWAGAVYDGALHVDAEQLGSAVGETSLRHEALHAALHGALEEASPERTPPPTWLDEGLAQYFAPEDPGPERSFALIARERTVVPLPSMDGAFMVIDDPRDAGLAYHQALLMVLWLVDRRGERGIADAVRWLSEGGEASRVLEGIGAPLDGEALIAFASVAPH